MLVPITKAADIIGIEVGTLKNWLTHGRGPRRIYRGRSVLFESAECYEIARVRNMSAEERVVHQFMERGRRLLDDMVAA